ncbi:hypothetical protein K492DRAFT_200448 [Lichtheimia hyalospora FSU 10163]|nr:hypothetical protein K492DRAFT_200448 [Lichtheimia hyalospora FSU 10163]
MQQRDIIYLLPYEVLDIIFRHLSRNDVLECTLVSRPWYVGVNQYASAAFNHITLHASEDTEQYEGLLARIGHHVKSMAIDQCPDGTTLANLIDILGYYECRDLEVLELRNGMLNSEFAPRLKTLQNLGYVTISLPTHMRASTPFVQKIVAECSSLISLTCISSISKSGHFVQLHDTPLYNTQNGHVRHLHLRYPDISIASVSPLLQQCPNISSLCVQSMQEPDKKKIQCYCQQLTDLRWATLDTRSFLYNDIQPLCLEHDPKTSIALGTLATNAYAARLFIMEHSLRHLSLHVSRSVDFEHETVIAMQQLLTHNANTLKTVALSMNAFHLMQLMPSVDRLIHLDHLRLYIRPFSIMRRTLNRNNALERPGAESGTEHALVEFLSHINKSKVPIALGIQNVLKVIDSSRRMEVISSMIGKIPQLKEIEIREPNPSPEILASLFHHARQLKAVSLVGGRLQVTKIMLTILSTSPQLEYLQLQGIGRISTIGLRELADRHEQSNLKCQVVMLKPDNPNDAFGKCFAYARWKMGRDRFEYRELPAYE